jgi:DNA repair exonuclease SbcCD ATPase subunit
VSTAIFPRSTVRAVASWYDAGQRIDGTATDSSEKNVLDSIITELHEAGLNGHALAVATAWQAEEELKVVQEELQASKARVAQLERGEAVSQVDDAALALDSEGVLVDIISELKEAGLQAHALAVANAAKAEADQAAWKAELEAAKAELRDAIEVALSEAKAQVAQLEKTVATMERELTKSRASEKQLRDQLAQARAAREAVERSFFEFRAKSPMELLRMSFKRDLPSALSGLVQFFKKLPGKVSRRLTGSGAKISAPAPSTGPSSATSPSSAWKLALIGKK